MAKKTRRKTKNTKENNKSKLKGSNDINGIILICLGIFVLFSVFASNSMGIVGVFIKKILIAMVGLGALTFPILMIFIGVCIISKKNKINFNSKFYGIVIFLVTTLLLIQMVLLEEYDGNNVVQVMENFYNSKDIIHGGLLSYSLDKPLFKLFGSVGSYIIFLCLYIISFILIFQVSLSSVFKGVNSKSKDFTKKINVKDGSQDKKEKMYSEPNYKDDEDSKKDKFIKNVTNKIKILDFMKSKDDIEDSRDKDKKEEINIVDSSEDTNSRESSNMPLEDAVSIDEELNKKLDHESKNPIVDYTYPGLELLKENNKSKLGKQDKQELLENANKLEETLSSFGVEAKVIQVSKGPSVTRFELQPSVGVKVSKIVNLADDIALNLAASAVRIEAPIPGKSAVGIEVPNKVLTPVYLREVIESDKFTNFNKGLAFALGKDISGNCAVADIAGAPHLLIAGATGSGKSVCINSLILSILYKYSPENVKLLMIDPKVVELSIYNGIPHLLIPVVTDPKKAAGALNWAVNEMDKRYDLFAQNNVRSIESYNKLYEKGKIDNKLPYVVIIIDELADLMMVSASDVENYIARLAQKARAAGMHLVIATQRPSVDVITGMIKANIPSRISFAVSSSIDSRTILDMSGAEKLLGKGDMLFFPSGDSKPTRIQGAFISESEVEKVVENIKKSQGEADYREEIIDKIDTATNVSNGEEDELLGEAIKITVNQGKISASFIQRRLKVGYNRAARIIEQMEDRGIISQREGNKARQVIIDENDPIYGKYFDKN